MIRKSNSILDFLLYSNLLIALGAASLTWQSAYLLTGSLAISPYITLVFLGTLMVYAAHRVVGFSLLDHEIDTRRAQIIRRYSRGGVLIIVAILPGIIIAASHLSIQSILMLMIMALLALGYVWPVLRSRRLRDLPYVKIYLIVIVWTGVSVVIPSIDAGVSSLRWGWIAIEKSLFIYGITLPFEVRDRVVDQNHGVKTMATIWKDDRLYSWAMGSIIAAAHIVLIGMALDVYSMMNGGLLILSYVIIYCCIRAGRDQSHDYYYTGLLDGTILMQSLILLTGHI